MVVLGSDGNCVDADFVEMPLSVGRDRATLDSAVGSAPTSTLVSSEGRLVGKSVVLSSVGKEIATRGKVVSSPTKLVGNDIVIPGRDV